MKRELEWSAIPHSGYNPPNSNKRVVNTNGISNAEMHKIMGYKGKRFKKWTTQWNIDYIWYKKDHHEIELWGREENLNRAKEECEKYLNSRNVV